MFGYSTIRSCLGNAAPFRCTDDQIDYRPNTAVIVAVPSALAYRLKPTIAPLDSAVRSSLSTLSAHSVKTVPQCGASQRDQS